MPAGHVVYERVVVWNYVRPSAWLCFDNQCTKEHRRYYCTRVISYRTARRPGGHVGVGEVVLETCFHFSNKKFVEFFSFWRFFCSKAWLRKQKVANYQVLCSIVEIYAFFFWYFCVPCTETGTGYITVPLSPAEGPLAQRLRILRYQVPVPGQVPYEYILY